MNSSNSLAFALFGVIALGASAFTVWQHVRPWVPPIATRDRVVRSVLAGLGMSSALFSLLALVALRSSERALENWMFSNAIALACFTLPFGVITAVGSFAGLGVADTLKRRAQSMARERGTPTPR